MRNSEYLKKTEYRSSKSFYVDGNAARKIEVEEPLKKQRSQEELEERRRRRREEERARAQRRQSYIIRAVTTITAVAIMVSLVFIALNGTIKNNILAKEISGLEVTYEKLLGQNDSKEYDIDKSVDLNTIIKTATEEYGMVRSSIGQIVTYEADRSEYIQQMAEIPSKY